MSNKKIVVIGSGISGIVAAYFQAKKGNKVTLIDSDPRAGGLLKSDNANNRYFDYGTHLLSRTDVPELDNFLFAGLNGENCEISKIISTANYFKGVMSSNNSYVNIKVLGDSLYKQSCNELLESNKIFKKGNLEDLFLQKFGNTIYSNIYKPLVSKFFGTHPKELSPQVGNFFDMSHVLAFDENTTQELCKSDIYNSKLGHHVRKEGVEKYYPKNGGIGRAIELMIELLEQLDVDIKLNTKIKQIKQDNGSISKVVTNNEIIELDKLIWTLPCSYLLHLSKIDIKTQPPKFRSTGLFDFTFEKPLKSEAAYINVYDFKMFSARITCYQNISKTENYSCTVEVLADEGVELKTMVNDIEAELCKMGLVDKTNQCTFKQFRPVVNGFPILTNDFVEKQNALSEYCESYFENVSFIGRSTGKTFFMKDVLLDAFNKLG